MTFHPVPSSELLDAVEALIECLVCVEVPTTQPVKAALAKASDLIEELVVVVEHNGGPGEHWPEHVRGDMTSEALSAIAEARRSL